jgi:hypothetical protein
MLYERHELRPPADGLQAECARAGKEVKHLCALKVNAGVDEPEQGLTRPGRGGARLVARGCFEAVAAKPAGKEFHSGSGLPDEQMLRRGLTADEPRR